MQAIHLHNLMASSLFWGVFWSIFIFLICFLCVHTARLLQFGWKYQKQQQKELAVSQSPSETEKKKEQEKTTDAPQKEIYYIVERKRKAPPYSNPKRIDFK